MKTPFIVKLLIATFTCFALAYCSFLYVRKDTTLLKSLSTSSLNISFSENATSKDNGARVHESFTTFKHAKDITISTINADIHIKRSSEPNSKILIASNHSGRSQILSASTQNDKLDINLPSSDNVTIYLPQNIETLSISNINGDIDADNIQIQNINFHNVNGDINLINLNGKQIKSLKIDSIMGDINLQLTSPFKNRVNARSVTGEVNIKNELLGKNNRHSKQNSFSIKTVNGDITIE